MMGRRNQHLGSKILKKCLFYYMLIISYKTIKFKFKLNLFGFIQGLF